MSIVKVKYILSFIILSLTLSCSAALQETDYNQQEVCCRQLLNDEYTELQTSAFSSALTMPLYLCGWLLATAEKTPNLHILVGDAAKKLKMNSPLVFIFEGNMFSRLAEELGILDLSTNVFCFGLPQLPILCIGQDIYNDLAEPNGLTVGGLQGIIAREMARTKHYETLQKVGFVTTMLVTWIWMFTAITGHSEPGFSRICATAGVLVGSYYTVPPTYSFLYKQFQRYCFFKADEAAAEVVGANDLVSGIDRLTLLRMTKDSFFQWFKSFWYSTPTRQERIAILKNH